MRFKIKTFIKSIIGFLISGICIYILLRSIDLSALLTVISQADIKYLIIIYLVINLSYVIRTYRTKFLVPNDSLFLNLYKTLILGFFYNNTLPARMGEFMRAHYGAKFLNLSRATVLSGIFIERILDGFFISLIFAILFPMFSAQIIDFDSKPIYMVAMFFGLVSLGTIIVILLRHKLFKIFELIIRRFPSKKLKYILVKLRLFIEGFEIILTKKNFFSAIFLSLFVWLIELSTVFFAGKTFGLDFGVSSAVLLLATTNFASLIPSAPGAVGVIEAAGTAVLVHVGVNPQVALSIILIIHAAQLIVVGIPGVLIVLAPKTTKYSYHNHSGVNLEVRS